jgi:hypothetical protein
MPEIKKSEVGDRRSEARDRRSEIRDQKLGPFAVLVMTSPEERY